MIHKSMNAISAINKNKINALKKNYFVIFAATVKRSLTYLTSGNKMVFQRKLFKNI